MAKKPDRPEMPPQKPRDPPMYAGFIEPKTCSNCQHYRPSTSVRKLGECRNGISGKLSTGPMQGCAYGFYPSIELFPIGPGAGGVCMVRQRNR